VKKGLLLIRSLLRLKFCQVFPEQVACIFVAKF
jgi:hypothetical protein